jgi:hypothetical protein
MASGDWHAFYQSDVQGLWLLVIAPLAFLAALPFARRPAAQGADPTAAGFVGAWALVFALETLLDPLATGPLARALGIAGTPAHTALIFVFVLLGDFRVLLLLFHLAARERALGRSLRAAAPWTLLVPLVTLAVWGPPRLLLEPLPSQVMWLVYETAFAALALWLRARGIPARLGPGRPALARYLRAVCAFVAAYYALWAAADVLILLGVDAGWGLRVIPNQLYYAFTVPFAYFAYFAAGRRG